MLRSWNGFRRFAETAICTQENLALRKVFQIN
ncbi:hypothetical protein Poly41_05240 [Novipirellula artificiosorum]|uniref:Uncharacterized protein n=1 Tax=Novipirellula artificiosorum TaxID=2528016 RepID=A0A5C6E005_9BACT|nr:hypothetical protein Poly41_05240 [Novipirellula artificiosorum]